MNQQLIRRLRELERRYAEKICRSRDIRIVWATARRLGGPPPRNDSEVVPDSTKGYEPNMPDEG